MTWHYGGYIGSGCEALITELRGQAAIIAGSGKGVFEEVSATQSAMVGPVVFAVNDVSVLLPHIDHMVSLHSPKLDHWSGLRRDPTSVGYGNTDFRVHDGGQHGEREWHQWTDLSPLMAHSGMFAAQVAYLMGCVPIILCGCPEDATPRFWESEPRPERYYKPVQRQIEAEMNRLPEFKYIVRSCSGWTQSFFGRFNMAKKKAVKKKKPAEPCWVQGCTSVPPCTKHGPKPDA